MTAKHEPTEATKAEVKALASMGIRHEDIADYIGIDNKTLYKYYSDITSKAKITAAHKMAQAVFRMGTEQNNVTAAIFWLKCHAGWSDKQEIDITTNGESINKPALDTSKLTDEQLRSLDTILSQASETGTGTP